MHYLGSFKNRKVDAKRRFSWPSEWTGDKDTEGFFVVRDKYIGIYSLEKLKSNLPDIIGK